MSLLTKNDEHEANGFANLIDSRLHKYTDLNFETTVKFDISHTAAAARKVSKIFDTTLRSDCMMHCLSLCISYGVGLKENTKTKKAVDLITNKRTKKSVKAGEYRESTRVIRKLRKLNKYFVDPRATHLGGVFNVDVRGTSVVVLIQRSITNYTSYMWNFQRDKDSNKDKVFFTRITVAQRRLVIKIEATVNRVAELDLMA
ncbi:hypothetical protein PHMEG_00033933 [Phytophthora megakarya]|uniref:Uncharacterized protein n=1 Tax=Phytophthora megakarya TaxID=4795 RepID=A0A225USM3_9STRA|nr:hypothetical protein PHMEG_00033933 [Phytophthora megakarya]